MIILNLLTGTAGTGVSVTKDGESLISIGIEGGIRQSETIFKMIDDVFSYIDLDMKDIDAISILNGPGSFTGLRVGMAAAKAISYSLKKPIIPVDTLKAIIAESHTENACAMIDARRDRVYFSDGIIDSAVYEINELLDGEGRLVFGEGLLKYKEKLEAKGYKLGVDKDIYLSVKGLARASLDVDEKDYEDYMSSTLNYLKTKEEIVSK
uniref:tRNA (adenosine(37)-N6)-threonylcarbamoyltransferase complex dimerization subunit type 1 TsaB n=1 Tax=Ezakiella massiliensis TaxID=1852374 RepID=UPI00094EAA2D|nr:tRNA (adenosine(37)-N6)-threonylcarbamoyltransferase complex dimerization subunit type 1 TsaB [Ezakiella massiliensis]